ncbi:BTAD domain-containing putative transcriptional regulator [Amycolatopsis magusensis]|uniref:BTAD domain-containing putative transcriptional regulator n=1 Tax=Amycolatopsis magusensis TaxID=882444 RepID=UPI0037A2C1A1
MRFGVLGPLAVWTDGGEPVPVPESKVRALLALLLVHKGRVVSRETVLDGLWGERLPADPGGALRLKVSRLRQALAAGEPGAKELVLSRSPGYLLRAGSVDAERFRALHARASDTADLRARAELLEEALGLWRGPAFADFDEPFARAAITELTEERLLAVEDHLEARLDLGEQVLGEVAGLVAEHPLRQRLRAVLMRALYRAGRQSEALDTYTDLRERLAGELGLDPSPELAELHQAILRQDRVLAVTPDPLPAPLTELVGRERALTEVGTLLSASRLVTLTGPGGVGKTRLAVEVARRQAFPDGVWLVELAGATEVAEAASAVLGLAELPPVAGEPVDPAGRLAAALRGKRLLLVFDNCEHVVGPVAELTGRLLRTAPGLRVLTTTQEPLGLTGEQLWPVPPLDEDAAVRLFTARAPGFTLTGENAPTVRRICRRLDGIPLALELAAARVRAIGVTELAARLDDRFRLLTAGRRDAPARQKTLRAVIDWSWELLSEPERAVLRRLAVHADGCTLEAAEAVCGGDGLDVLDVLARLVDRSLVVVVETAAGVRYRLLETVRAYGLERLREAGEDVREGHRRYYADLAARAEPHLRGHGQRHWLEVLDAETANLRAALETAPEAPDLPISLAWYWFLRGRLSEAVRAFEPATPTPEVSAWLTGFRLLLGHAVEFEAVADARLCWFLAYAHRGFGDLPTTAKLTDQALADLRAQRDRWGTAAALSLRATLHRARGDLADAERDAEAADALFRELGDRWGMLKATNSLAELAEIAGDYPKAKRLHEEGFRWAEELGLFDDASFRLSGLGRIALLQRDYAQAADYHRRAMRLAVRQSNVVAEEFAEIGLALGARRRGDLDNAERHLRRWVDWLRQVDGEPGLALVFAELGFVAEQRGDAAAALALHTDGLAAAHRIGDPRAVALALEGLAGAAAIGGDHAEARRLLAEAEGLRESVGAPLPAAERLDVDRIRTALGG